MLTLTELINALTELRDEFQVGTEQVFFRGTPYYIQMPVEKVILNDDGEVELIDDYYGTTTRLTRSQETDL